MDLTVSRAYARYVVISDPAIITVERRSEEELRQTRSIATSLPSFAGPVVAAIADRVGLPGGPVKLYLRPSAVPPVSELTDVLTCWTSDVPDELTALPGWPKVESYRPVTFYPRAVIEGLMLSWWRGIVLTLAREAAREVAIPLPAWDRPRVRTHLLKAGYRLRSEEARGARR
jgi:hypothetical protein